MWICTCVTVPLSSWTPVSTSVWQASWLSPCMLSSMGLDSWRCSWRSSNSAGLYWCKGQLFNSLLPRQHGCHFADDTLKRIFFNEIVRISMNFSLKFVPKGPIHNIPALVQIMAWCRLGNKPLSEPMMVRLLTHIYVTRPQWVNSLAPGKFDWNFRHVVFKQILVIDGWSISCEIALIWMSLDFTDDQSTLVQVMAWWHQATSYHLSQCWPRSLVTIWRH